MMYLKRRLKPLLTSVLRMLYRNDRWLPVADETGTVCGKVGAQTRLSADDKYYHPIVRIALIHKDMLFLQEKEPVSDVVEGVDSPMEVFLKYRETLEEGVARALAVGGLSVDIPCHYVCRYVSKDILFNRLIHLCICNIRNLSEIESYPVSGRWWASQQIEENMGKGFFSQFFEKEYELLKNTVLRANKLMLESN